MLVEAPAIGFATGSGLHSQLRKQPDLVAAARANGRILHDMRVPSVACPIANGVKRNGKRMFVVGTDCSVGKMYTAHAMDRDMRAVGMKSTFRAMGQTGILVIADGVPPDAVVADFMTGLVEWLTPDNDPDHWNTIQGQGSLFHVSFSGVTLALILILIHELTRTHMRGLPGFALPSLEALRDMALPLARMVNPDCKVVGVSVNTQALNATKAMACRDKIAAQLHLPACVPFRQGVAKLVAALAAMSHATFGGGLRGAIVFGYF